jgi:hypothetical protein
MKRVKKMKGALFTMVIVYAYSPLRYRVYAHRVINTLSVYLTTGIEEVRIGFRKDQLLKRTLSKKLD